MMSIQIQANFKCSADLKKMFALHFLLPVSVVLTVVVAWIILLFSQVSGNDQPDDYNGSEDE